jgi:hypothetical protein
VLQVRTLEAVKFVGGVGMSSDMVEGCNYPVQWAREIPYVTVMEAIALKQAKCGLTAEGQRYPPTPHLILRNAAAEQRVRRAFDSKSHWHGSLRGRSFSDYHSKS